MFAANEGNEAANEGLLRNRCSRGILELEDGGVVGECKDGLPLRMCSKRKFCCGIRKIVAPNELKLYCSS